MIKSEVSEQYLLEEDAVEGFRQAVNNGQIRLALQILVDIVDVFEGFIASVVEDDDDDQEPEVIEQKAETAKQEEAPAEKVETPVEEAKEAEPAKKAAPKKATPKEEETKNSAE